jgi:PadR family transcriptional regulator, regulatory protein PadR
LQVFPAGPSPPRESRVLHCICLAPCWQMTMRLFPDFLPLCTLTSRHMRSIFLPRCRGIILMARNDLQGTLDLLILKTLSQVRSLHGYGIVQHIQRASNELLQVEEGSLYPALHRMEQNGWLSSDWVINEGKRKAKYYKLTPQGRRQLAEAEQSWEQLMKGVQSMLRFA